MPHTTDAELIANSRNTARYFSEHRQIAWVLLAATLLWGVYGYVSMPQRKDPDISIPVAVATCQWPGVGADQVEQQVTRRIEKTIAENSKIRPGSAADFGIKSLTLPGLSIVYVQLDENVGNPKEQFSDINLKLSGINNQLPSGAGPIQFQSDFADTAALMLTVASPPVPEIEVALRARTVQRSLEDIRKSRPANSTGAPLSVIYGFPNRSRRSRCADRSKCSHASPRRKASSTASGCSEGRDLSDSTRQPPSMTARSWSTPRN